MESLKNRVEDGKKNELEKILVDENLLSTLDIDLIEDESGKEEMPVCGCGGRCKCCGGSAFISHKLIFLSKRR